MKHIKFTYVDSKTKISVAKEVAVNGPVYPDIPGLVFDWARESAYPTNVPELFGTCTSIGDVDGFLQEYSEYDYNTMKADELRARQPKGEHLTRLAFLNRFTDAEAIALDLASIGATVEAAAFRRYINKVNASTFIDTKREDTRAGVQHLESIGIIGAGRALEILDAPITELERAK